MNEKLDIDPGFERFKKLILTSKQYMETSFAQSTEAGASHVFELHTGEKAFLYIGAEHTNDPGHPLFREIEKHFNTLKPDIVYVEGWEMASDKKEQIEAWFKSLSLDSAKQKGEPCFTLKLAVDAGIDYESPEPSFDSEVAHLEGLGFSDSDIFTFYTYRIIEQYQREHSEKSAEECLQYLHPFLVAMKKSSGFDPTQIISYEKEIIENLDLNSDTYKVQVDPIPWEGNVQTVINEIARASSAFRDEYIFARIAEGLKTHDKIFVVYGSAHAVAHEPAFRALFAEFDDD